MRYSTGAIILHWAIAIAVITNWRLAEATEGASREVAMSLMGTHKALGITILFLTILRIAWRLTHTHPPMSASVKGWEVVVAKAVHALFYILLIALPLIGWVANSAFGRDIDMFGLFTIPALPVAGDPDMGGSLYDLHKLLGTTMLVLIALHILGALKHHILDRNGELYRMLPFGTPRG
ncbi:cytochrome b [Altericroceibacterium spongiae]|uniref:Cytochrome b n=1 Tax=Altericroceibacterium spongiae TaxID=2320269 RepID=A0A420EK95_9SPHN|nr:cytochrome b [Altericroceibacterium spongiae]RKF21151.1 cytochrome b [Altericroceibacterium spongiae]